MAENSTFMSDIGRSLLADSSILDSKVAETSKENIFTGPTSDGEEEMPQIETRVVLVQEAAKYEELLKALEEIKVPYIKTESLKAYEDSDSLEFETIFVIADFQDSIFNDLYKADCRVLGPPIVMHCARKGEPLPFSCRPLYCASMLNLVLCFTGFRKKEELVKLVTLVHHMGGIIRRDFSSKVTHLVASSTQGDKFRVAVSLGTPIMKAEWIFKAWERRDEIDFCAANEEFRKEFKVPPFQDCLLSFLGFSDEEKKNMEEMTEMQGGQHLPVGDTRCTHLIVEENTVKDLPFEPSQNLYVVKQEWFWGSIQMDARAGESMYLFEKPDSPELKKSVSQLSLSTPNSNRKRRRLKETLAQLTRETDMSPFPPRKRPSAEHSLSMGSFLDISNTPESNAANGGDRTELRNTNTDRQRGNFRFNKFSRMRRKTCRLPSCIPLDNVAPQCCINSLESLQKTIKAAVSKPSESLVNGASQGRTVMNLQKYVLFPMESKEASVSLCSLSALKYNIALCDHHLGRYVSRPPQDGDESASLTFPDQDYHLGHAELDLECDSCTKRAISKYRLDQILEPDFQNKLHFFHEVERCRCGHVESKSAMTCANVSAETQQVICERSSQEQGSKERCTFDDGTPINEINSWTAGPEPILDLNSGANFICTNAVLITETPKSCTKPSKNSTPLPPKQSARWQVAKELYQTESNYVDILTTIIQVFQVPLEKEGQLGGPILAPEEIKTIFGSIPDILDVHIKIKEDLEDLMINWAESKSIGDVILKYSKDLLKTYPPFVNFFEMSKETITKCEKQKPRFHAFLKINQAKPECGRQSLAELLIRPVQRLPSVALLLNDIKKHTVEDNPDKATLERAIESLKEVMTHINEDKRKTEAQRQIFDVVYEVDGCPANLLSSHRSLIQRLETVALGDDLCDRGEQVTLFLFNDCLEIARKRHKVIGAFKSPHGHTRPPASLKHIILMPLSQIKKVLDIRETEDCHKAFALVVRPPTEQTNLLFSFQITIEEPAKEDWLKMLCRHVANTICKADAENLIYATDPDSIEVNTKDMDSTLSRASRAIKKTSKKVTRAFSFSKTPKRALRRALMAHNSVDEKNFCTSESYWGGRMCSSSSLAMTRSSSTYSLTGSIKHFISVQRSNSIDGSSQSARPRPVTCNSHGLEGRITSSSETLDGHSLANPCLVITANSGEVSDDRNAA
ncbi:protein ECT2 isoform X2 [Hemicordylus capensis]|uniref:protein ECT2 isoform X2 n=1 Tax=Hemicordylus capensis TaxID=884348 RepID=UPI002304B921|nr:protein ECT2 isoform X2 [Hemicordylus capensis]